MNVAIINFNIIMYPYINLYYPNKPSLSNKENNYWEYMQHYVESQGQVCYDAKVLKQIADVLSYMKYNGVSVNKVYSHKDIISELSGQDIQQIYNADCFVRRTPATRKSYENYIDTIINNSKNPQCVSNIWYYAPCVRQPCPADTFLKTLPELEDLIYCNVDVAYFLYTEDGVPSKYRHLFELLNDMICKIGGQHD